MRSLIPNSFTIANLICGMLAIFYSFEGEYLLSAILIIGSLVADAFDGRTARALNVSGEFGKELDSLCDVVSFGVAPGFLIYHYAGLSVFGLLGLVPSLIFAACGALRLARFNTMTDSVQGYFLGMPIPTGGCLIATYVIADLNFSIWISIILVLLWGPLMVSTFKFPDFKGGTTYRYNKLAIILAIFCGGILIWFNLKAVVFAAFFGYMLFGMVNTMLGALTDSDEKE